MSPKSGSVTNPELRPLRSGSVTNPELKPLDDTPNPEVHLHDHGNCIATFTHYMQNSQFTYMTMEMMEIINLVHCPLNIYNLFTQKCAEMIAIGHEYSPELNLSSAVRIKYSSNTHPLLQISINYDCDTLTILLQHLNQLFCHYFIN